MNTLKRIGTTALLGILTFAIAGQAAAQSQSWFKQIKSGKARFKPLPAFNKEAVVDKETGLVWELEPSGGAATWHNAAYFCRAKKKGNRMGWRLPTIEELASLVDFSQADPALPNKHPFVNITNEKYWTSTTPSANENWTQGAESAHYVSFAGNGSTSYDQKSTNSYRYWCVRGGSSPDGGVNHN